MTSRINPLLCASIYVFLSVDLYRPYISRSILIINLVYLHVLPLLHILNLQALTWALSPGQAFPPLAGLGSLHNRERRWTPIPHEAVQGVKRDHRLQWPSTGAKAFKNMYSLNESYSNSFMLKYYLSFWEVKMNSNQKCRCFEKKLFAGLN